MERENKDLDNFTDYVIKSEGTEGANHIILRFSLLLYFVLLGETFLQYTFIENNIWEYVCFWGITAVIICQVVFFILWRKSQLYGRTTLLLFTVVFVYLNVITDGNNLILLLPVPIAALCMLYMSRRMMVELYLMWALNGVLRFVQIWNSEEQMKLLQGFAWVVMICIVYAVAVYMVNESISTHYREVCHDLHHENRLHTKLYQQSTVDSTTGILNRNAYNNYVIEYKEGNCDSISCIYIDVNGLHEYNNTYGHQAGDKMLKTVAAELKECFAEHSHYRIGGDEFVIICENTAFMSILMQLNHFREQMKIHNIYIASGMEWRDENMNLADMIKKADAKMYRDKERFYKAFPNARECGMLYQNAVE